MLLDINYLFSCNFHDFIAYHNHSIMVAFSNLHLSPLFFTHYNLLIVSYSPHFYDFLFKSLPNIYQNHPHHDLFLVPSHRAVVVNYLISRFSIHLNYTSTQLISLKHPYHTLHRRTSKFHVSSLQPQFHDIIAHSVLGMEDTNTNNKFECPEIIDLFKLITAPGVVSISSSTFETLNAIRRDLNLW